MAGCFHCGTDFPEKLEIFRSTTCLSCGKDAKVCLNCKFYSKNSHWECRETVSEQVKEKDRSNFCEYFKLNPLGKGGTGVSKADSARNQFNSLFGDD